MVGSTQEHCSSSWPAIVFVIVLLLQDMHGSGLNGSGPCQVVFRLVVPNANCGSLIGKGGNNIRELREVSSVCYCCYQWTGNSGPRAK